MSEKESAPFQLILLLTKTARKKAILQRLPECIFRSSCLATVDIADCLVCYIHLAETCDGDFRKADVLYLSILRWRCYHIKEFLWFVSSINSKKGISRYVASIPLRHSKWPYKNSNISCQIYEDRLKWSY